MTTLVEVRGLRVELSASGDDIVDDVCFDIAAGEIVGLIGESGCGKTTTAMALMKHVRRGAKIGGGSVRVADTELMTLRGPALRAARGELVAYVAQDPGAALNPSLRIWRQIREVLDAHGWEPRGSRMERVLEMLREVKLPFDRDFLQRYPHQLSGGQQQRVLLAIAFALGPRVVILDEPTTGLDVTTQAHILRTIAALCRKNGVGALYVTHDLAVVASLADRVLVMYAGKVVEEGPTETVIGTGAHPYTRKLLAASPDIARRRDLVSLPGHAPRPGQRDVGCSFLPRCEFAVESCKDVDPPPHVVAPGHTVRCIRADEVRASSPSVRMDSRWINMDSKARAPMLEVRDLSVHRGQQRVLRNVSLDLAKGECLAIVGESGAGKTTLARSVIGLISNYTGDIVFRGDRLSQSARSRSIADRRALQYVFQNPYASLNPRRTVAEILATPFNALPVSGVPVSQSIGEALEHVSLPQRTAELLPHQLSGGERQRVAIARALICKPDVLICDEVTSALDVSVQASIVALLHRLQTEHDLALMFITHNLALVRAMADRIILLREGEVVEENENRIFFESPRSSYTRKLLRDTPSTHVVPTC